MSITCMNRVWACPTQSGTKKLLLLALADRADDDGFCWPGVASLAQRTGVSERQVQRMLRKLEADGEIFVKVNVGRYYTNQYVVLTGLSRDEAERVLAGRFGLSGAELQAALDNIPILEGKEKVTSRAEKATPMSPFRQEKVTCRTEKVTSRAGNGDIHVTRSIIEPSYKSDKALRALSETPQSAPEKNQQTGSSLGLGKDEQTRSVFQETDNSAQNTRRDKPKAPSEGVRFFRQLSKRVENDAQRELLLNVERELGTEALKAGIKAWFEHGWNRYNVAGMVQVARQIASGTWSSNGYGGNGGNGHGTNRQVSSVAWAKRDGPSMEEIRRILADREREAGDSRVSAVLGGGLDSQSG